MLPVQYDWSIQASLAAHRRHITGSVPITTGQSRNSDPQSKALQNLQLFIPYIYHIAPLCAASCSRQARESCIMGSSCEHWFLVYHAVPMLLSFKYCCNLLQSRRESSMLSDCLMPVRHTFTLRNAWNLLSSLACRSSCSQVRSWCLLAGPCMTPCTGFDTW